MKLEELPYFKAVDDDEDEEWNDEDDWDEDEEWNDEDDTEEE